MGLSRWLILFSIVLFCGSAQCQEYYHFITFKDKATKVDPSAFLSKRSLKRRVRQHIPLTQEDYPVNPEYIKAVLGKETRLLFASKWKNAVLIASSLPT